MSREEDRVQDYRELETDKRNFETTSNTCNVGMQMIGLPHETLSLVQYDELMGYVSDQVQWPAKQDTDELSLSGFQAQGINLDDSDISVDMIDLFSFQT